MKTPARTILIIVAASALLVLPASAAASTAVPGKQGTRVDADGNGSPDAGVVVNGQYTSLYAYDGNGDYYWDLGDGRVFKTVASVDDLDSATLTSCDYVITYRGTFENDPFMDGGVIQNHIRCHGHERGHWNYQIVHETDPRYAGNPDWSIWGEWEYHVLTESGNGNLVHARPYGHVGG